MQASSLLAEQQARLNQLRENRDALNPVQGCSVILYFCPEGETPSLDNTYVVVIDRCANSGAGLGNIGGLENFQAKAAGQREAPEETVQRETGEEVGEVGVRSFTLEKDRLQMLCQANDDTNFVMKKGFSPVNAYVFAYRLSQSELDGLFPGATESIKKGNASNLVRQGHKSRVKEPSANKEVHSMRLRPLREVIATADFASENEAEIFRYAHELLGQIGLAQSLGIDVLEDESIRIDFDAIAIPMTWHIQPGEDTTHYLANLTGLNEEKLRSYREARRTEGLSNPERYTGGTRFQEVQVDAALATGNGQERSQGTLNG